MPRNKVLKVLSSLLLASLFLLSGGPRVVSGKDQPEYSDDDQSTDKKKYPDYSKTGGFTGWVDPDTREEEKKVKSYTNGKEYVLIMSDEFGRDGRSFHDGADPMWTSMDKNDEDRGTGTQALEFYNSTNVWTADGNLVIRTNSEKTEWVGLNPYESTATKKTVETFVRNFKSGMIQSWNKFCFTGGIFEIRVKLPGTSMNGGLWPAAWLLGNLGRATYEASNNLLWPWSFTKCDRHKQKAQTISGCDVTAHYALNPRQGRGATEIDIIEVMAGESGTLGPVTPIERPYVSMTLQTAPGIPSKDNRPYVMTIPEWGFNWYKNLSYGHNVSINPFFYGTYLGATNPGDPDFRTKSQSYQADAISCIAQLDDSFWQDFHTWRLEWQPPNETDTTGGYVKWYIDGDFKFEVSQSNLDSVGLDSKIPMEPSSIIINTAISNSWGFPPAPPGCTSYNCDTEEGQCGFFPGFCSMLPADFLIDYVHVYQDPDDSLQTIGCNPPGFPTKRYIKGNEADYLRSIGNYIDKHPLKPVVTGGSKCSKDTEALDCGGETGYCLNGYCTCVEGWMGPKCLVPTYKNNFTDWDENVDFYPMQALELSTELLSILITFALLFLAVFWYVFNSNKIIKEDVEYTEKKWQ